MVTYELRQATSEDLNFVYELNKETMKDHVIATFGEWKESWQRDYMRKHFDPSVYQIILVEGVAAGILALEQRDAGIFLKSILLLAQFQNEGIGNHIMKNLISTYNVIELKVFLTNERARKLYESFGFIETLRDDTHIYMKYSKHES